MSRGEAIGLPEDKMDVGALFSDTRYQAEIRPRERYLSFCIRTVLARRREEARVPGARLERDEENTALIIGVGEDCESREKKQRRKRLKTKRSRMLCRELSLFRKSAFDWVGLVLL
jgi:hypothetical protein